jgi:spermidine synthase
MTNPWIDVAEADYVGHMNSAEVGQQPVLAQLFLSILHASRPTSILILGGGTGNGLEHVDPHVTARVEIVDINPSYVRHLSERYPRPVYDLTVQCADVSDAAFGYERFDLIHAALLLEYVPWRALLPRCTAALRPGGVLSVVLQTPSASSPPVTVTRYTSLRALEAVFHFVDPVALIDAAARSGLALESRQIEPLPAGKTFDALRFRRTPT